MIKTAREESNPMAIVSTIVPIWVDAISRFVIFETIKRERLAVMIDEMTINMTTSDQPK